MSEKENRTKVVQATTNELLTDKFQTEIGQKAHVERTTLNEDEHTEQLRMVLADVAADLQKIGRTPKGMEYLGSYSVHVFKSDLLKVASFVTLNNGSRVPFDLADAAMRELNGSVVEYHGKRRQKLRSGF